MRPLLQRNPRAVIGLLLSLLCMAAWPSFCQDRPKPLPEVEALLDKAGVEVKARHLDQAMLLYEQAVQLARDRKDRAGEALGLSLMGEAYRDAGQAKKALPFYEQSLPMFEELGDKRRQAMTLINMSRCYLQQGHVTEGLAVLDRARQPARDVGDKSLEAMILHNLAGAYGVQEDFRRSIDTFLLALPLLHQTGQKSQTAICLSNLSFLSFRTGDFLKSLEYAAQALAIQKQTGNKRGIVLALDNLASCYSYLSQQERALQYELQALALLDEVSDVRLKAQVLNNLGRIYGKIGRLAEEKEYVGKALTYYRQAEDVRGEAFAVHFMASNRSNVGERAEATRLAQQALALFQQARDQHGEGTALLQLGDFAYNAGNKAEAMERYKQALALYEGIDYTYGQFRVLSRMGADEEDAGDLAGAERLYAQALALQEDARANLGALSDTKSSFQESALTVYQKYIRVLLKSKQEAKAFEWAQRAKARSLVDLMDAAKVDVTQKMTDEDKQTFERLKANDRELSRKWLAARSSLNELKRQARPDPDRLQGAEREADTVKRQQRQQDEEWKAFTDRLYLRNPDLARQQSARTLTLEQAASALRPDTALLEYVVLHPDKKRGKSDEVMLFVVTQQGGKPHVKVFMTKTAAGSLARMAAELRQAFAGRPGSTTERPYQAPARALYRLLVAAAEAGLSGKRRLIVCPDGPLWDVPFQGLLGPSSAAPAPAKAGAARQAAFLWERFDLAYSYSATGMKAALDTRTRANRPRAQRSMLVMADPAFDRVTQGADRSPAESQTRTVDARDDFYVRSGGLGALPYTRLEASAIARSFPDVTVKLKDEAQEAFVKQSAQSYRNLHFATHAAVNDAAPMLSGIVLAYPPKESKEDGILTAREILGMSLGADMVVLSACETARGAKKNGEGIVGLTWALFVAGVPAQVVSQWAVDDAATAKLMGGFYQGLKQGRSKEAALRTSALALMRDGKHSHPFYWAPFVVMGDWR